MVSFAAAPSFLKRTALAQSIKGAGKDRPDYNRDIPARRYGRHIGGDPVRR